MTAIPASSASSTRRSIEKGEAGEVLLAFDLSGAVPRRGAACRRPYAAAALHRLEARRTTSATAADYQTIYAREEGAVAAPTAGLHFTPELFAALDARGIERAFRDAACRGRDVPAGQGRRHRRPQDACRERHGLGRRPPLRSTPRRRGANRVVAVGTTSLRLLESAAREDGTLAAWSGATDIFITPGYRFRVADALMTNFHLPRSTLFMLVSAFSGLETMRAAYAHAIDKQLPLLFLRRREPAFPSGGMMMDDDLDDMDRDALIAEVKRLRAGIRKHRDSTGHDLCWHHPDLWDLLPEQTEPAIAVPPWPKFMRGCIRYRQSLDEQAPDAPVHDKEFDELTAFSFRAARHRRQGAARRDVDAARRRSARRPSCRSAPAARSRRCIWTRCATLGADIILGNTYHLMLRPGAERVARLGGLHEFARWPHPILTDSGGFQVMSLAQLQKARRERRHLPLAYRRRAPTS